LDRNPQNVARKGRIQAELNRARDGKGPDDGHVRLLETRLRAVEAEIESNKVAGDVLTSLLTINQGYKVLWQLRYEVYAGTDPEKRRAAYEQLRKSLERIQPWVHYTQRMLKVYRSQENDQEQRLATVLPADPARQSELEIRDSYHRRRVMYERLNNVIEGAERSLLHWQKDFGVGRASRSFTQRLADGYALVAYYARKVWNFELFAVEDTVEVAGQKVTTSRGVTVGKSIGAVILFFVGYLLVSFTGRRLQAILVSRFSVDEQTSNVLRRWIVALAIFLLLVLTLNLARIPLTVFAFLGGALAIGVGFGTQTLIKNFISGILMLLERKVRVGDIVEVEGIVGRVTEVDLRSSTVQGFDGVETLIPNASFLENRVTNWTYTSPKMRRVLRVGVAYGSPAHAVADVLMQCAERHGLILNDPEPYVLFEDFGDSSLVFALFFWIEMLPHVNANQVASDLRYMIDKKFSELAIDISFPQRDVHLDTVRPLQVQVVSDNASAPEG
ncbi:MAG: mechanosensitive ion channel, partial [Deltaproteobacteria bacterium]|nr:mechanosensitive ion channel [Deltaproteobacteria bacterium]